MESKPQKSTRLNSIDMLRGLVIVLMALDHSRDFFGDLRVNPQDPETTSLVLFLTRFVTHYCAPTFVFLAGISAWLYGNRQTEKKQLSWFLFSRGLWLLFLDHTVLYFSYTYSPSVVPWIFLVISAIGSAMIMMSALCWLPSKVVGVIGLVVVAGHNLLDPIHANNFGQFAWVWNLIHERGFLQPMWMNVGIEINYPVLPWFGILASGYGLAPVFKLPSENRRRVLLLIGSAATVGFFILRGLNVYGDPQPWSYLLADDFSPARTAMSFANCCKYPPSLCYVLMTLGPALIILSLFEQVRDSSLAGKVLLTFGRVPLFFYILHFYVLHLSSVAVYWVLRGKPISSFAAVYGQMHGQPVPEEYGFSGLIGVYIAWVFLLCFLFPICWWYGKVKRAGKSRLWSYL